LSVEAIDQYGKPSFCRRLPPSGLPPENGRSGNDEPAEDGGGAGGSGSPSPGVMRGFGAPPTGTDGADGRLVPGIGDPGIV
jgi:hypothetical protein